MDFTTRNPACWKKCLRKAYLAKRDASELPVDTQDPPLMGGTEQHNQSKNKTLHKDCYTRQRLFEGSKKIKLASGDEPP